MPVDQQPYHTISNSTLLPSQFKVIKAKFYSICNVAVWLHHCHQDQGQNSTSEDYKEIKTNQHQAPELE